MCLYNSWQQGNMHLTTRSRLQWAVLLPLYHSFTFKQVCSLESVICGHHIYKQIWRLLFGEILTLEPEEGNNRDKFVSLLKDATVVGHVPREMFWHSLRHGGTITCEVTGGRKRGKGLEVPWQSYFLTLFSSFFVCFARHILLCALLKVQSSFIKRMHLTHEG